MHYAYMRHAVKSVSAKETKALIEVATSSGYKGGELKQITDEESTLEEEKRQWGSKRTRMMHLPESQKV